MIEACYYVDFIVPKANFFEEKLPERVNISVFLTLYVQKKPNKSQNMPIFRKEPNPKFCKPNGLKKAKIKPNSNKKAKPKFCKPNGLKKAKFTEFGLIKSQMATLSLRRRRRTG